MKDYIKKYGIGIALFLLFFVIFLIIPYMYHTNLEGIFYSLLLCTFLGGVFIFFHFLNFRKRHEERMEFFAQGRIAPELLIPSLPKPVTLEERDYDLILRAVLNAYIGDKNKWLGEKADMTEYFGTWVHQIKTPISAMDMRLQMEDTDSGRAHLRDLLRIRQYVEMALYYIRLDDESSDLVFKSYSLDNIIREAIHKFAAEFIYKKLSLSYNSLDYQVVTDEKWLSFILEQLLSNAIKYTNKGGIKIYMEKNVLIIEDTGIGIAPEDVPRVFEKGYTGYNGRADKKATGIGLYLCKRAAGMLSHEIWLESAVGEGTKVFINLHRDKLEVE